MLFNTDITFENSFFQLFFSNIMFPKHQLSVYFVENLLLNMTLYSKQGDYIFHNNDDIYFIAQFRSCTYTYLGVVSLNIFTSIKTTNQNTKTKITIKPS